MADIERQSGMDPAEGSRESVGEQDDLGRGPAQGSGHREGGGITNRPIEEERRNQEEVPGRGRTKAEEQGPGPNREGDQKTVSEWRNPGP